MKLNKAIEILESFAAATQKKSELRVYNKFIGVLFALQGKTLKEESLPLIENKLDLLILNAKPENKKKYFNQKLREFEKFLKVEFSFVTEGYYIALGLSFGAGLGVTFGTIFRNPLGLSLGISFGVAIGLIVGAYLDSQAEKQNRVLKTSRK